MILHSISSLDDGIDFSNKGWTLYLPINWLYLTLFSQGQATSRILHIRRTCRSQIFKPIHRCVYLNHQSNSNRAPRSVPLLPISIVPLFTTYSWSRSTPQPFTINQSSLHQTHVLRPATSIHSNLRHSRQPTNYRSERCRKRIRTAENSTRGAAS